MRTSSRSLRALTGAGIGVVALFALLAVTGPNPETEMSYTIHRMGGPCLQLEKWGLFGWDVIGHTSRLTQVTEGDWQRPGVESDCQDIDDRLILVRLPPDATPGSYRICGLADDLPCMTVRAVPFEGTGPGP